MKPDWFLIANATHARLYEAESGCKLKLVRSFEHPAGRLKAAQLGSDRRGVAFGERADPHLKEHLRFARQLAQCLERGALQAGFDSLHVFASHPFLGELKRELGENAKRHLVATHGVDLTPVGPAEIDRRIRHELAQA